MKARVMAGLLLASVSGQFLMSTAARADVPTPTPTSSGSQSVLMRRPLDLHNGNGIQTGTPTPSPTPTPTPGPTGMDDPDIPGGKYTPDPSTDPQDPGSGFGTYQWTTGPWQGAAVCGQPATLTRTVGCQRVAPDLGPIGVVSSVSPKDLGKPEIMQASWGMSTGGDDDAKLVDGVYDPASSDVKAHLAQFGGIGGNGGGFKVTDVPVSYCMAAQADIGPPPINSYTGTKGGCDYTPVETGVSDWQMSNPYGGDVTCSADAFRTHEYKCMASDGTEAPLAYCVEDLQNGGSRNSQLIQPEYGNFSGCTARWVTDVTDNYCHKAGDTSYGYGSDGPVHTALYESKCIRSDGTELTGVDQASCAASDRPFDGIQAVGSCHMQWAVDYYSACMADGNEVVVRQQLPSPDLYTKGTQLCAAAGATCCSVRMVDNDNYSGAPYGSYEVIGTKGGPSGVGSFYFDDRYMRNSDKGEGPFFYNYGGGTGRYEPDFFVGGRIDPNPPGGGGGGPES